MMERLGRRGKWAIALIALAMLVATFPMRLALGWADAGDAGFSARGVSGSIWSAHMAEAQIGALALGDLDASLSPLALLGGRTELHFKRRNDKQPPLAGSLIGGDRPGFRNLSGTASLAGGLGLVPIDSFRLTDVAVRFDRGSGRCVAAAGQVQAGLAAPIAGLDLSRGLSGSLRCADGMAQASLASDSGMERLSFAFDGKGQWRARFMVRVNGDANMGAALTVLGFEPRGEGFVLSSTGRF